MGCHRPALPPPPTRARAVARRAAVLALLALAPAITAGQERTALPEDGRLVAGEATVARQEHTLTITQHSRRAVLEWRSFDIGADASVRFIQPSSTAVALNRVIGGNPSRIAGRLSANGHVYLVNAAGVLFAPGARVDVGHLVTSSAAAGTREFLAGDDLSAASAAPAWLGAMPMAEPLPPALVVADPPRGDGVPGREEGAGTSSDAAPGGLLTLDIGAGGHLRIGLEPAQVQALIEGGGLQQDGEDLVLSAEGGSVLAASAVAVGDAAPAAHATLRDGRLLLVAGRGAPTGHDRHGPAATPEAEAPPSR